jgi:hypothetical protein
VAQTGFSKAVLVTGLIAGAMDITGATIHYLSVGGSNPVRILNFVASGVFGKEALEGGAGMAAMGMLFHMFNAYCFTLFFYLVFPLITKLFKGRYAWGVIYGVGVWCVMNLVVVPLSNVAPRPLLLIPSAIAMFVLIVCIGMPISIRAHRFYSHSVN